MTLTDRHRMADALKAGMADGWAHLSRPVHESSRPSDLDLRTAGRMIAISIKCVPPSITAQQKRVTFVNGKPRFFHGGKMQEQTATWTSLLQPFQPEEPMDGPLELAVRLVYPHLKSTKKTDVHKLIPKTSKPTPAEVA